MEKKKKKKRKDHKNRVARTYYARGKKKGREKMGWENNNICPSQPRGGKRDNINNVLVEAKIDKGRRGKKQKANIIPSLAEGKREVRQEDTGCLIDPQVGEERGGYPCVQCGWDQRRERGVDVVMNSHGKRRGGQATFRASRWKDCSFCLLSVKSIRRKRGKGLRGAPQNGRQLLPLLIGIKEN